MGGGGSCSLGAVVRGLGVVLGGGGVGGRLSHLRIVTVLSHLHIVTVQCTVTPPHCYCTVTPSHCYCTVTPVELRLTEVTRITGVELSIRGSDAFLFDWISVSSQTFRETRYLYNVKKQVLSRDSKEGVTKVTLSFQGDKTYTVGTVTGTVADAGSSSIGLSMILEGENGELAYTSYIEPKEGRFEEGETDLFELRTLPDLGTVKCVTLQAAGSDAWYFDFIAVEMQGGRPVLFVNTYQTFLSADSSEGMTSMKLCA